MKHLLLFVLAGCGFFITNAQTENYVSKFNSSATPVDGSIYNDDDGLVGIGTTTPGAILHVDKRLSTSDDYLLVTRTQLSIPTSVATLFKIQQDGMVGIGTASPQALLNLQSNNWTTSSYEDPMLTLQDPDGNEILSYFNEGGAGSTDPKGGVLLLRAESTSAPAFAIVNPATAKIPFGVGADGTMALNIPIDAPPLAQVDIRRLTGSGKLLNIGDVGVPNLFTITEQGNVGIGIDPPFGTLALKGTSGTTLDMWATASEGYNMQIRMIDGEHVRHIITDDPSSGTDALMILPGYDGTSNHRLWVQGVLGVGINATSSTLAVKGGSDTKLDLFETSSTVTDNAQLRFIGSNGTSVRHKITEDASGNLLIDAGVTSGGATDKVKIDGDATVSKTAGIGIDVQTNVALAVKGSSDTKIDLIETSSTVTDNAQLRFIGSNGTSIRHKITEDASGNLLIDAGVASGGATDKVKIDGDEAVSGNLGIGESSPGCKLELVASTGSYGYAALLKVDNNLTKAFAIECNAGGSYADKFVVYGNGNTVTYGNAEIAGTVKIGSQTITSGTHADAKLFVTGKIAAKYVVVTESNWADHVFNSDYNLRSLPDLENYIAQNHHLPEVPDECEVQERGVNVGEMNATLLKKVEELTLYILAQQKQLDSMKQQLAILNNR